MSENNSSSLSAWPRGPLEWLRLFGPGAIIASMTIGTGELVFSSRGGAIFGYRMLWIFVVILLLKWVLTVTAARHIVLTGVHPLERWMELPGPRGWLPTIFLILAILTFPVWAGFLSGVTGTLLAELIGFDHHVWGAIVLIAAMTLIATGGYRVLERAQLVILGLMMGAVTITLFLLQPDWLAMLHGMFVPQTLEYPSWVREEYPLIAARPLWVELATYVSVIGGSSYDYLAYVAFVREKRWGFAGETPPDEATINEMAANPDHPARHWVRAPFADCTLSFLVVLIFAMVFVASGALVLGPEHKIPSEANLLNLQGEFVTRLHPWLWPLYIVGALLTMLGTVYCTFEMFPTFASEMLRAVRPAADARLRRRLRGLCIAWVGAGGLGVLAWSAAYQHSGGEGKPTTLVDIITPTALFTGVLSCAFVCYLNNWIDRRFLPAGLRMHPLLAALNYLAAVVFVLIGVKSYWDYGGQHFETAAVSGGWVALALLACNFVVGFFLAKLLWKRKSD